MSLNKFMHPRNIYRKPPDFKALAIKYPEFRKFATQNISGKVSLDFKNLEAIRALTCTLLKEDFDLDVEIPLDRLIPTLSLRLNYLLWIQDILAFNKITNNVTGIDIGCGASCVYPLIAAKQFGWSWLATEKDPDSVHIATANVRNNDLDNKIKVKAVEEGKILEGNLDSDSTYDFSMCNPPFFSCLEELKPEHVARSPSRSLPRNAHSGAPGELVVPGGETAFIAQIIQDSLKLKNLVRIYTVMVGHKSNVSKVKQDLKDAGDTEIALTEFCQGRTTRWGIAWSLDDGIKLPQTKGPIMSNKKKSSFTHPSSLSLNDTVERLHKLMDQLQITYSTLKKNSETNVMTISAKTNTWSNSRKKRRQEKVAQTVKIQKETCEKNTLEASDETMVMLSEKEDSTTKIVLPSIDVGGNVEIKEPPTNPQTSKKNNVGESNSKGIKRKIDEAGECSESKATKLLKTGVNSFTFTEPFLFASLIVHRVEEKSEIELCWLRGEGGRDSAHQVLQYFKNNLNTS